MTTKTRFRDPSLGYFNISLDHGGMECKLLFVASLFTFSLFTSWDTLVLVLSMVTRITSVTHCHWDDVWTLQHCLLCYLIRVEHFLIAQIELTDVAFVGWIQTESGCFRLFNRIHFHTFHIHFETPASSRSREAHSTQQRMVWKKLNYWNFLGFYI